IAGGEVLDPQCSPSWLRSLLKHGETLDTGLQGALLWWINEAAEDGISREQLSTRLGTDLERSNHELQKLEIESLIMRLEIGNAGMFRWISSSTLNEVAERTDRALTDYQQNELFSIGMPKAVLLEHVFREKGLVAPMTTAYLRLLQMHGKIE